MGNMNTILFLHRISQLNLCLYPRNNLAKDGHLHPKGKGMELETKEPQPNVPGSKDFALRFTMDKKREINQS